ncbi:keratin-associated protein 5-4-like isoform X1 [Folsomia candida]|uniref:keratin-associated protein 5-4-like isoform X1 n=1 Tax=Folsomia candida TaxID=158441 RepID=UPI001604CEC4|nr:keratin-associated protein 5-4-like isoform X1 [Folsomia candida]
MFYPLLKTHFTMWTKGSKSSLPKKTVNLAGYDAKLGTGSSSTSGGDTGLPPASIYYCARTFPDKKSCRCWNCPFPFVCGPKSGCPCAECADLLGFRVNSAGDLAKPGGSLGDGGDTAMTPQNLFYCGKWKMACRCGTCDGQCGPLSGCPCHACVELVGFRVNRDGVLCRKEGEVWYCGKKRKGNCECGGDCGEKCGGSGPRGSGCPCEACSNIGQPIEEKLVDLTTTESEPRQEAGLDKRISNCDILTSELGPDFSLVPQPSGEDGEVSGIVTQ